MTSIKEVKDWLEAIKLQDGFIAIGDEGLSIVALDAKGKKTDAYLEIGGIPDNENYN